MREIKPKFTLAIAFLAMAFLIATSAAPTPLKAQSPMPTFDEINQRWKLSGATVIDPGQTSVTKEGTMITGFKVEAAASTTDPAASFRNGKFEMTLTVFSPAKDMPGQKAGRWYVFGEWAITDPTASEAVVDVKHNPAVLDGSFNTDLSFNPAATHKLFIVRKKVPMTLMGGQWVKGQMTIVFDKNFDGTLSIVGNAVRSQP